MPITQAIFLFFTHKFPVLYKLKNPYNPKKVRVYQLTFKP